jgi:hypothetical protein
MVRDRRHLLRSLTQRTCLLGGLRGESEVENVDAVRLGALNLGASWTAIVRLELDQERGIVDQRLLNVDVELLALLGIELLNCLIEPLVDLRIVVIDSLRRRAGHRVPKRLGVGVDIRVVRRPVRHGELQLTRSILSKSLG